MYIYIYIYITNTCRYVVTTNGVSSESSLQQDSPGAKSSEPDDRAICDLFADCRFLLFETQRGPPLPSPHLPSPPLPSPPLAPCPLSLSFPPSILPYGTRTRTRPFPGLPTISIHFHCFRNHFAIISQ